MKVKYSQIKPQIPVVLLYLLIFVTVIHIIGIIVLFALPIPDSNIDTTPPVISLNGEKRIILYDDETFEDPGVTAYDGEREVEVEVTGKINKDDSENYLIEYTAKDDVGNIAVESRIVTVLHRYTGKIYLTFDDGPSAYTAKLLDILKKYNVKATFFVTGYGSDEMIAREYNEGHAVALHSFTHDYANIYSSIDNYFADLYRIQERVKSITGYTSYLMRFPGGSSNTVSAKHDGGIHIMSKLVKEVGARGFTYFDWNVTSGDAGGTTSSDGVYQNVINRVYRDGKSIVLQHDSKGFSVDAVERIIQWGLANGFTFDKLDASSFTAHHGVNN